MIPGIMAGQMRIASTGGEYEPVYSQSSLYSGLDPATGSNMRDSNDSVFGATGTGTNNGTEWIMADLGTSKSVSNIKLGGGFITGWGAVSPYLNGTEIQFSTDSSSWTSVLTVSGVQDSLPLDKDFPIEPPVSARYWRISRSGYIAAATFRLYGPG